MKKLISAQMPSKPKQIVFGAILPSSN